MWKIKADAHGHIMKQFGAKIRIVRSDNGNEFLGVTCQNIFEELGIVHQTTCFYTPQQNGRAERKHRQLLQIARAIIFQAALPLTFWGEVVLHATYIINRLPSQVLEWKTPHEILHYEAPYYN